MSHSEIRQYDYVRITKVCRFFSQEECKPGNRTPVIGDIAAVIEIYDKPKLGYELESVNEKGETIWLITINASDLEFEKVTNRISLTGNISRPILVLLSVFFVVSFIGVFFTDKGSYWWRSALAASIVSGIILAICLLIQRILNRPCDDDDDPQFPPVH